MLTRIIDFLKNRKVTMLFTSLTPGEEAIEQSDVGISSLMDTWLLLRMVESSSERNRVLYVLKARGMAHSHQMREFQLTSEGIRLIDVYVGPGEVYTGSARLAQESRDRATAEAELAAAARRSHQLRQDEAALRAQIESLKAKHDGLVAEMKMAEEQEKQRVERQQQARKAQSESRKQD